MTEESPDSGLGRHSPPVGEKLRAGAMSLAKNTFTASFKEGGSLGCSLTCRTAEIRAGSAGCPGSSRPHLGTPRCRPEALGLGWPRGASGFGNKHLPRAQVDEGCSWCGSTQPCPLLARPSLAQQTPCGRFQRLGSCSAGTRAWMVSPSPLCQPCPGSMGQTAPLPQELFSKVENSVSRLWRGFVMTSRGQFPVRYSVLG